MKIAEPPGGAVIRPEYPVRNMLKKHIVDVPVSPVRYNAAQRAAWFFRSFLKLKKINMFINSHDYSFNKNSMETSKTSVVRGVRYAITGT
jgi:hypothetical protein